MFQFVDWLKVFAAMLITNSHYADIWPVSAMAMGGHIGNCLYFFLSGFCLYNIKDSFPKWYAKRIIRIYPVLWIVNAIDLITGRTSIGEVMGAIHCFIYPTWFHFIGSIMLLYILFYLVRMLQNKLHLSIEPVILFTVVCYFMVYIFAFDKSSYHIDDVSEKWCRFMFFASMLFGAAFRERYEGMKGNITVVNIAAFVGLSVLYFVGKIAFSHIPSLSAWQWVLPVILVCYICSIATLFIKMEKRGIFQRPNQKVGNCVRFISSLTLEIYLGQTLILWLINDLVFPISFFVVTGAILIYAWILHQCSGFIQKKCKQLLHL